ncbi:11834_t:CDS:2 [Dentiscutata erythropus]|uniref:11834_t:CDS:1 n=1 Tax=Dentiscutata erythropus TaxID=1348616 RepID=A0A9N9HR37_9GLOM|nr:11834_t:CDS:2 [Dentiscutata erythropus]
MLPRYFIFYNHNNVTDVFTCKKVTYDGIDVVSQHLAQLYDKAIDAEDRANRANQEEILCGVDDESLDKVEPGQRGSLNQALSHDDNDCSHNNDSKEEMPNESDDDGYSGCGGYNEYGERDKGYYDLNSEKKTSKNSDYLISAY